MTTAEKIRNLQNVKTTGKLAENHEISDELNPAYLFSTTWTALLSQIAKGEIDANRLARVELANRGLDLNGNWIGFKAAKAEHKI